MCMLRLKHHEYCNELKAGNHAKEETWTFRHTNAPTVGPGIKSMGAQMRLQHAKA